MTEGKIAKHLRFLTIVTIASPLVQLALTYVFTH